MSKKNKKPKARNYLVKEMIETRGNASGLHKEKKKDLNKKMCRSKIVLEDEV